MSTEMVLSVLSVLFASDAHIGVLDRPVGADNVPEALSRELGAEQEVAGVAAFVRWCWWSEAGWRSEDVA